MGLRKPPAEDLRRSYAARCNTTHQSSTRQSNLVSPTPKASIFTALSHSLQPTGRGCSHYYPVSNLLCKILHPQHHLTHHVPYEPPSDSIQCMRSLDNATVTADLATPTLSSDSRLQRFAILFLTVTSGFTL